MNQRASQPNSFFRLPGQPSDIDQKGLFDLLKRSDHLRDSLYKPDTLEPPDPQFSTKIANKTFERVSFTKTTIRRIRFMNCKFIRCLLVGAQIEDCEFHRCEFLNTNTHKIKIVRTYIDPGSFTKCLDPKKHQNIGVHLYQVLMNNSKERDQPEFEADARFEFFRWKRYQDLYEVREKYKNDKRIDFAKIRQIVKRWLWEKLFGSGIRWPYLARTALASVTIATFTNYTFRDEFGLNGEPHNITTIIDAFYFSMVTLTTLGFGDIAPTTQFGRAIIAMEGAFGLVLFALFASMMFRKIAP